MTKIRFFICGSALRGQPDHENLQGAEFVTAAQTKPLYRLHAVKAGWHPGIYAVESDGISIPGEVYEMTVEQYQHLLANEPPDMYEGKVILTTDEAVSAMLYPRELIEQAGWPDISHHGGWAAYKAAQSEDEDS